MNATGDRRGSRSRIGEAPERAVESYGVKDRLPFRDRPAPPVQIKPVVIPCTSKFPEPRQVEDRTRSDPALLAPRPNVVFRPEEEHRGSGKANVAPPVTGRNRKVNDPRGVDEGLLRHREEQRLPGVRARGGHGSV